MSDRPAGIEGRKNVSADDGRRSIPGRALRNLVAHRSGAALKVALVSPLYETVPPSHYGGTERVIAALADELVKAGHDVTLFACEGSATRARLVPIVPGPLRSTMTRAQLVDISAHLHLQMLAQVYDRGDEFDIVHAHTDIWTLPFSERADVPTVITMHGRLDLEVIQRMLPLHPRTPIVSISNAQREPLKNAPIPWAATCPNGLPLQRYLASHRRPGSGEYLAFIGRLTPEKRPDWAVEIARRVGLPLRVAAKIDPLEEDYWTDTIGPLFARSNVDFVGELAECDKPAFLAGARALLFPIDWPEPFGLVMIESLAAGTPVVARRRGAVPEILEHGVSGVIGETLDDLVDGVFAADQIAPDVCRRRAIHFNAERMTRRYIQVYRRVIANHQRKSAPGLRRDAG